MPEAPKHRISPRAKRVWARLGEWYGTKLADQYGPFPPKDWCDLVDDADNEQIKIGLNRIRGEYLAWPPTLPQFADAIKPVERARDTGPTVLDRLIEFVVANRALTRTQLRTPWTFLGREFDAPGPDGKMRRNHGVDVIGVVVPADGDHPGYRVMLEDLELERAA